MRLCVALELPYPPSVNEYWRAVARARRRGDQIKAALAKASEPGWREVSKLVGANVYRTKKGNEYREAVAARCLRARVAGQLGYQPLIGVLDVRVIAYPALLQRKRDADNLWKALLDALTFAQVILDDSQFVDDRIRWGEPTRSPCVRIAIGRPEDVSDREFLGLDRPQETPRGGTRGFDLTVQPDLL